MPQEDLDKDEEIRRIFGSPILTSPEFSKFRGDYLYVLQAFKDLREGKKRGIVIPRGEEEECQSPKYLFLRRIGHTYLPMHYFLSHHRLSIEEEIGKEDVQKIFLWLEKLKQYYHELTREINTKEE